jgi:hypothetical protein
MQYLKSGIGAAIIALSATCHAQFVLQPNELLSKDAKGYQFLPGFNFQSNLGVVNDPTPSPDGHSFKSLIQFDLTAVPYSSDEITLATLELYCFDIAPFTDENSAPIPGSGVGNVSLYQVTAPWAENTVGWGTFPTFVSTAVDTEFIGTEGQWYTFDVTEIVKSWTAGSEANNGLAIVMDSVLGQVTFFDGDGGPGDPTLAPRLTVVPEPGTAVLGLVGLAACGVRRVRKQHSI